MANAKPATRIGDRDLPHCSLPTRAQGSDDVFVNGIPWSLFSHLNDAHLKPGGEDCVTHRAPIATGSDTVFINGLGAGRIADEVAGCTAVAEGSDDVFAGESA